METRTRLASDSTPLLPIRPVALWEFYTRPFWFLRLLDATLKGTIYDTLRHIRSITQPRYSFSSSDSSSMFLKEKGTNAHPLNSANLEKDSTQANLSE